MRALLLLVLLLAGCATPGGTPPGTTTPTAPLSESGPVTVGPGATEASFTIAPDGVTWLACTHGVFRKPSPLYASLDAGATWKLVPVPAQPAPSGDCDVAVTPAGAWVVAYDTVASAAVAVSKDRGATWTATVVAAPPLGGVDRPWIASAGGRILMTWCDLMGIEPAACFFSASSDTGATWSTPVAVTLPGVGRALDVMGRLSVSADGRRIRVPVAWANGLEPNTDLTFTVALSDDGGATWSERPVAGPMKGPPQFTSLSWAADGTLWYSYSRGPWSGSVATANLGGLQPLDADIILQSSTDDGRTWSAPLVVAEKEHFDTEATTWVDVGPGGDAVVAWVHQRDDRKWVASAAIAGRDGLASWDPLPGVTSGFGVDYLMTGHDPQGRALLFVVMGDSVLLSRR